MTTDEINEHRHLAQQEVTKILKELSLKTGLDIDHVKIFSNERAFQRDSFSSASIALKNPFE